MSGLEKFQANKAWRAKVKKLLVMQRNPTPPVKVPESSQRFSLDLEEGLQVLLEERTATREGENQQSKRERENLESIMYEMENDENKMINVNFSTGNNKCMKSVPNNFSTRAYCDDTILEWQQQQTLQWQRTSDESFMALEKMCDKTASDPNSTLFHYLHSENKELIVEDVKKRSADGNYKTPCRQELQEIDEEANSLQRLLHDLCVQEQNNLEIETPLKGVDVTQLDDIEAPSKLWDFTIIGDTTLQTSPVKMMGLLRPSTIIEEENGEDQSNNSICGGDEDVSSHMSFQSAQKGASETSATSYYETAQETISTSVTSKMSNGTEQHATEDTQEINESVPLINLDKTMEPPSPNQLMSAKNELSSDDEVMITRKIEQKSPTSSIDDSSDATESVIEILSDDEKDKTEVNLNKNIVIKDESMQKEKITKSENNTLQYSNKLRDMHTPNSIGLDESFENDKENRGNVFDDSSEKSLHFNDTMEEVEYMMKKGMQYMAAAEPAKLGGVETNQMPVVKELKTLPPIITATVKPLQARERTFTYSPKKLSSNHNSPAKKFINGKPTAVVTGTKAKSTFSSPRQQRTPLTSAQKPNRFVMSMKPIPKLELFKKPQTSSAIPSRLKEANTGSKQFSHIVSPIGAYMKNTGTTPLMSNLKQRTERPDVSNASVFRELEQETRIYQPKFGTMKGNTSIKTSSLPKKAYISSEFKHIVDERTPVTIPGGRKIQKYLENAMLPTVVRHEGKLKMPNKEGYRKTITNKTSFGGNTSTQRNNGSLANLSLMSGDISVYTMKDAQKF